MSGIDSLPNLCTDCQSQQSRLERKRQYDALFALGIYRLPPELLLNILERIDMFDFPSFLIATFHLLQYRGIAPILPSRDLFNLLTRQRRVIKQPHNLDYKAGANGAFSYPPSPLSSDHERMLGSESSIMSLPREIKVAIGEPLDLRTRVCFVLAVDQLRDCDIERLTHLSVRTGKPFCTCQGRDEGRRI